MRDRENIVQELKAIKAKTSATLMNGRKAGKYLHIYGICMESTWSKKINVINNYSLDFGEPVPTDDLTSFHSQIESTSSELKPQ